MDQLTLGSLFDGIGGFPYAASFYGIRALWASEIVPECVSVTKRHFPEMEHIGDITKLDGGKLPPVDIITFGSPCQDLSIASGKRLGLAGERSGLFLEAIRIIREMKEATNGEYPKFALWENVPGALSSSARRDFKAVLEAFAETEVPMPCSGRWANAGMVRGRGVDLAWCVYDAQHFGTAQRRRRIFLVADFRGECAGEILFVPKSLSGYFAAGGTPRQGVAAYAQDGAGTAGAGDVTPAISMRIRCGCEGGGKGPLLQVEKGGVSPTLRSQTHGNLPITAYAIQGSMIGRADGNGPQGNGINENISFTLNTIDRHAVCTPSGFAPDAMVGINGNLAGTLLSSYYKGTGMRCGRERDVVLCASSGQRHAEILRDLSPTLNCASEQPYVVQSDDVEHGQPGGTYLAKMASGGCQLDHQNPVHTGFCMRRLTPTEAERLQGYPDGWTQHGVDGKAVSDTKRYQMLGNSVAVPCVAYIMQGICDAVGMAWTKRIAEKSKDSNGENS